MFPHSSIKRLRFAFLAMAGLTLLGLVGGGIAFSYNYLIQKQFLTDAAPLLTQVERLSKVAIRYTATTQDLRTIDTKARLERVLAAHRSQGDALQAGLLVLAERRIDAKVVGDLKEVVRDLDDLDEPFGDALRDKINAVDRLAMLRQDVSEEGRQLIDRLNPVVLERSLRMIDLIETSKDGSEARSEALTKTLNDVQLLTEITVAAKRFLEVIARSQDITTGALPSATREAIAHEFRQLTQLALKLDAPDQRQMLADRLSAFNEKTLESGGVADQSRQIGEAVDRLDALSENQIRLVTRMSNLVDRIVRDAEESFLEGAERTRRSSLIAMVSLAVLSIAALLAVTGIGWRLINRDIARRLEHLAASTVALADGDLDVQVDVSGRDELADMARAVETFRDNARELRRSEAALSAHALELERSNRELDDFAYIASHDLKEPLRASFNHARFLLEDYEDRLEEDGKKRLRRLIELSRRMEKLIADLLYFSRLGRGEAALEMLDLHNVIAGIKADLAETLQTQNAEISVSGSLPAVDGHRPHVTALFRNLISNGIRYNDAERKIIDIGHVSAEDNDSVDRFSTFYVKDNGIGIEEAFSDDIFRIFKRLNSERDYGEGTGAGLSFVKKIVERQGGRIWLTSAPGEGTTFFFTLRRAAEGATIEASRNAA